MTPLLMTRDLLDRKHGASLTHAGSAFGLTEEALDARVPSTFYLGHPPAAKLRAALLYQGPQIVGSQTKILYIFEISALIGY